MYFDNGFSHALAEEILKDCPGDEAALKILTLPEKRMITDDGTVIDCDGKSAGEIESLCADALKQNLLKMGINL